MTQPAPTIGRHWPFLLAVAWEALCVVLAVILFLQTPNPLVFVAAMIIGGGPMLFVMTRFMASQKAGAKPDRSRDIVQ